MQITTCSLGKLAVATLAFTSVANAQWWNQLPGCSQTCAALAAQQSNCSLIDVKCICRSSTFLNNLINCIIASGCPQIEVGIAEAVILELCYTATGLQE